MREFHKRPANGVSELDNLLIEEFGVDAFPDAPAHTITLQTRRLSKFGFIEESKGGRQTVLFLHDIGVRDCSWLQCLPLAMAVHSSCDVDLLFVDVKELRVDNSKWTDVLSQVLPLLLVELGLDRVRVVGFGFGAGLWLELITRLPSKLTEGLHLLMNPEIPGRSPLSTGSTFAAIDASLHSKPLTQLIVLWVDSDASGRTRTNPDSRFAETFSLVSELAAAGRRPQDNQVLSVEVPSPTISVRSIAKRGLSTAILVASETLVKSVATFINSSDLCDVSVGANGAIEPSTVDPIDSLITTLLTPFGPLLPVPDDAEQRELAATQRRVQIQNIVESVLHRP